MPRFYHIYGPFSDRKRCRFDRPGLSRITLNGRKDAATTAAEKADIQQQIDNIGEQIKDVANSIKITGLLLIAFEDE